ncbi:MAG: hypothetical protein NT116_05985 [Candidatus Parcubacteria bacterium]|nr:hypothetical protein [Candidatus Parcubacteria bacterium]
MEKETEEQTFEESITEDKIAYWTIGSALLCALCAGIVAKEFFVGLSVFAGLFTIDGCISLASKKIIRAIKNKW